MPLTLAWRQAGLDHACQSGNMAILLTSILFVFEISFLPKYRVNYYDYIIKWCFGIYCNGCVSLDIAHILALSRNNILNTKNTEINSAAIFPVWHELTMLHGG